MSGGGGRSSRRSETPTSSAPAVLQLYSWGDLGLPVAAFAAAALSPSRELLLLRTQVGDVLLLPLRAPSRSAPAPLSPLAPPPDPTPAPPGPRTPPARAASSFAAYEAQTHPLKLSRSARRSAAGPELSPLFTPFAAPAGEGVSPLAPPASASASASGAHPLPFLTGVHHFAWGAPGDGPSAGQFREILFASTREGLFVHCFPPQREDFGGRGVSEETGEGSSSSRRRVVPFLVDAHLEGSGGDLQLRFGGHSWADSAEVVSFKFGYGSKELAGLLAPEGRKGEDREVGGVGDGASRGEEGPESAGPGLEIVGIISNPVHTVVGVVASRTEGGDRRDDAGGKARHEWGALRNGGVSIGEIAEWGVKWSAFIDLDETVKEKGRDVRWASLVLSNDRLLGLTEDGGVFIWAALSGRLVAFIDLVAYCDLSPKAWNGAKTGVSSGAGDLQGKPVSPIAINGETTHGSVDEGGGSRDLDASPDEIGALAKTSGHSFTNLVVTADCLLFAVTDSRGLLFLVSLDEYFASQASDRSPKRWPCCCREDLKVSSYWDVGGRDIGGALSSSLLPSRRCLSSAHDERDAVGKDGEPSTAEQEAMGGRENGPGPPWKKKKKRVPGATGFTSKVEVSRTGPGKASPRGARQPIRRVFLPCKQSERLVAVTLTSNAITTMTRPTARDEVFTIAQNLPRIVDGAVDERDLCEKMDSRAQTRGNFSCDAVAFCLQGFLYMVTATSLHVVLPPLTVPGTHSKALSQDFQIQSLVVGASTKGQWNWQKMMRPPGQTLSEPWQTEVLDRALVCDSLKEAEALCTENGWSLQLFHLRRLQLAVDFAQIEDVENALGALVQVGAAESGVLCVLFASAELMFNEHCSENELAQASRLLSSGALFTTRLIRQLGVKGWRGRSERHQHMTPDSSLESTRYETSSAMNELASFLKVMRTLQVRLQDKQRGPNSKKGVDGRDRGIAPSEVPNVKDRLEAIEEGLEDATATSGAPDQSPGVQIRSLSFAGADSSSLDNVPVGSPSSSSIVRTSSFLGSGVLWEVSPTGLEGARGRRRSQLESPSDMVERWETERVDAAEVVRDALKSSGRLALAVAQLHRMRMAQKGPQSENREPDDIFSEVLRIGRGIVYELLCKGKTALAMAALRRLGEDIETALRDLALGAVSRFLHTHAVKELQRLARLSAQDFDLFERVSVVEDMYANSSFWSTYENRLHGMEGATRLSLALPCEIRGGGVINIECGEVYGAVLGTWSMIGDSQVVEDGGDGHESASADYWSGAAVWLEPWDRLTFERILLEPNYGHGQEISWKAKLAFYVSRHHWQEVVVLLENVPSVVRREGMLYVHLDGEDALGENWPLPRPYVSDRGRGSDYALAEDDRESDQVVIPNIQILQLDHLSICNTLMWHLIEERLARSLSFNRVHWKGTVELMSLLARTGLLFHPYSWRRRAGSKSRDGSQNMMVSGPTKGIKFHRDAIFGVHEVVMHHCLRQRLPHFLEMYMDFHSLVLDRGFLSTMEARVGNCQWAQWLLYTSLPRREYDASFANARCIANSEVRNISDMLTTKIGTEEGGGEVRALSTLMYAPLPLQKCLTRGSGERSGGESWECSLENLRPGLDSYPTLWTHLVRVCSDSPFKGFAYEHPLKAGTRDQLVQYREWHQRLLSCSDGDTSLLQMFPRHLPQKVRHLLQLSIQGPDASGRIEIPSSFEENSKAFASRGRKSVEASPKSLESVIASWEAKLANSIEDKLHAPSQDVHGDCEHYLRRGRALAAFYTILGSRVRGMREVRPGHLRLHSSELQALFKPLQANEQSLLAPIIPLVMRHCESPVVVAAFTFFVELCGLSASLLRIDIASLKRISKHLKNDQIDSTFGSGGGGSGGKTTGSGTDHVGDVAESLAASLADEYVQAGLSILSPSADAHKTKSASQSILTLLQLLEKASLKDDDGVSPGTWLYNGQGDGLLLRTMQWSVSESWSLVTAFCRAHNLPLSTTYLERLARDNDWVGFLAEAQLEGCPLDLLMKVVAKDFTDARLQSHLLFVLKNLPGAVEKSSPDSALEPSPLSTTATPSDPVGSNAEMFGILAGCSSTKNPGSGLLAEAKKLQWPLLAVVASCFPDVTPELCLITWLEITVMKEALATATTDAVEHLSERLAAAVEATNAVAVDEGTKSPVFSRRPNNKRQRLSTEEEVVIPSDEAQTITEKEAPAPLASPSRAGKRPISTPGQTSEGPSGTADDYKQRQSLEALVAILCEQQRFLPLLRAFELFIPMSSFLPFLRFLHAFSQMRISEASTHLAAFTARLKEEMHPQGAQNRGTKGGYAGWITRTAIAAADAMHEACPTPYERRCLLQLLSGSDFGDGGVAAMRYRRLYWKIQLAEPALQEGSDPVTAGPYLDDKALFDTLEKSNQWEQARSWARQLDPAQSASALHRVTETQAEAMVAEWKELLWDIPEERVALWNHCQALFTMHAFPAPRAGEFFLRHADAVEAEISSSELHNILLMALRWLSGSICNSPPVYPTHFYRDLETRVWLLAVECSEANKNAKGVGSVGLAQSCAPGGLSHDISTASPISINFVERTAVTIAAVDNHLKRFSFDSDGTHHASPSDPAASSSSAKPATLKVKQLRSRQGKQTAPILGSLEHIQSDRGEQLPVSEEQSKTEVRSADTKVQPGDDTIANEGGDDQEEGSAEREAEQAVLALLEVGQVAAAKQLQDKLPPDHAPLELSLVESCLKVASLTPLNAKGPSISSALEPDVMRYLQSSGVLEDATKASPIEILDILADACRPGCGQGHCRRILAIARIAGVLGLTFSDAFAKSSTHLLQLLALKGQDALTEAKLLVSTHSILPASAAKILAEAFLKGLLAAHRGGFLQSSQKEEGPAPLLWRPSDFVRWAEVCPSEPEIGHALMRLVISGRDMPHACEVELMILAYHFYDTSACLDGMDVLVALAGTRVESYIAEGDYSALSRLITGISNFQALHHLLDFLIENGQLGLLLQTCSAVDGSVESPAPDRGFRMAVLAALKRFNLHDLDAFEMVYRSFGMAHEMADLLKSRGRKTPEKWSSTSYDPEQGEEILEMMRYFLEAAKVYSEIEAGNMTSCCCAQASLMSLQLRMPDLVWLNLADTNARRLMMDQHRFQESLIVAEAYGLNHSDDWVPVIWNQMQTVNRIEQFLSDFVAALPLTHSMLMELARFYRADMSARDPNHPLDFSSRQLSRAFRSLLKHTRDMKERLQLATVATGFPDEVDSCLKKIDNMPVTAGPLILRKGHGGTYVPIM